MPFLHADGSDINECVLCYIVCLDFEQLVFQQIQSMVGCTVTLTRVNDLNKQDISCIVYFLISQNSL